MEWIVLVVFAMVAAGLVALPLRQTDRDPPSTDSADTLLGERQALLAELRELDEDAAAGRISAADRLVGRRALAPPLRRVTEVLRSLGVEEHQRS